MSFHLSLKKFKKKMINSESENGDIGQKVDGETGGTEFFTNEMGTAEKRI